MMDIIIIRSKFMINIYSGQSKGEYNCRFVCMYVIVVLSDQIC